MPIDPAKAIGARLPSRVISWSPSDVLLYNIAVGAGSDPLNRGKLRFAIERDLQAIPTFASAVPELHETEPPRISFPGIHVDLLKVVLGTQSLTLHRPVPIAATAVIRERIADVIDKGSGALIARETNAVDLDGAPLWTSTMFMFAKGEGGFGGKRGPSSRVACPDRVPDLIIDTPTLPQQALLYRLCGDRNPMHADPDAARSQGFDFPFMHGLGTYGIVARALIESVLDCDAHRLTSWTARFVAPVRPGELLRIHVWAEPRRWLVRVVSTERGLTVLDDGSFLAS